MGAVPFSELLGSEQEKGLARGRKLRLQQSGACVFFLYKTLM